MTAAQARGYKLANKALKQRGALVDPGSSSDDNVSGDADTSVDVCDCGHVGIKLC